MLVYRQSYVDVTVETRLEQPCLPGARVRVETLSECERLLYICDCPFWLVGRIHVGTCLHLLGQHGSSSTAL